MAGEDPAYSAWIRRQPCKMTGCGARPPSEQHHKSGAGMGLRAKDRDSMPLCRHCHHVVLGRMPKDERREFEARAIEECRAAYDAALAAGLEHRLELTEMSEVF